MDSTARKTSATAVAALVALLYLLFGCGRSSEGIRSEALPDSLPHAPTLTPQEAIKDIELEGDFILELVAAEPQIADPVSISFDADGAMWVVEMRGYMHDVDGTGEDMPVGRIVVLRDNDDDGYFEHSSVFLDSLIMPRAALALDVGVLYVEPPSLIWVENRDYRPGNRSVVDSTFAAEGNVEYQPNGLLWAIDNWVYAAHSKWRYRFDGIVWYRDSTEFRGQWGLTYDDAGRFFYNTNDRLLLSDRFLPNAFAHHPGYAATSLDRYGVPVGGNRVYPRRETPGVNRGYQDGVLDTEGRLIGPVSACGPAVYRGDQFPQEYRGNIFVAEPAGNLVKRFTTTDSSGFPAVSDAYQTREFLTATDERFRPVNTYTAPDGTLYVVDMYRGVIQHRVYLSEYLRTYVQARALEKPIGLGRIYRVRFRDRRVATTNPRLGSLPSSRLVELLRHPNGWWRDTAQRLLVMRGDDSVVPFLKAMVRNSSESIARLHGLWTLDGLTEPDVRLLADVANTADRQVISTVTRLVTRTIGTRDEQEGFDVLRSLSETGDPFVDIHVALALAGFVRSGVRGSLELAGQLASKYGHQSLFRDAFISGLYGIEGEFSAFLDSAGIAVPEMFSAALTAAGADLADVETDTLLFFVSRDFVAGRSLYASYCSGCHGQDGAGIQGIGPPLRRSEWVEGEPEILIRIVLDGLTGPIKVGGKRYQYPQIQKEMPGHRGVPELDDANLSRLLSYVRSASALDSLVIEPHVVRYVRQASETRGGHQYTASELTRIRYRIVLSRLKKRILRLVGL